MARESCKNLLQWFDCFVQTHLYPRSKASISIRADDTTTDPGWWEKLTMREITHITGLLQSGVVGAWGNECTTRGLSAGKLKVVHTLPGGLSEFQILYIFLFLFSMFLVRTKRANPISIKSKNMEEYSCKGT